MNLETRKLKVIKYLINLQDQELFKHIEEIILKSENNQQRHSKPLSEEDLISRAKKSNEDYKSGNIISQEDLRSETKNW